MSSRDDFRANTRTLLAKRVGYLCSNPSCRQLTSGPSLKPDRAYCIGQAAHITAASPGGPRYDQSLSTEDRRCEQNGIWLCQECARIIDVDPDAYSASLLKRWKDETEAFVRSQTQNTAGIRGSFGTISAAEILGPASYVQVGQETLLYADILRDDEAEINPPGFYVNGAIVLRFRVLKNADIGEVLVDRVQAVVHKVDRVPTFQPLMGAFPYATNLMMATIRDPLAPLPRTYPAKHIFDLKENAENNDYATEMKRYAPVRLEPGLPETFDLRLNSHVRGMFTLSVEVVLVSGVQTQKLTVWGTECVIFEEPPRFD